MPIALEPLLHQRLDNLSSAATEFVQFASALGNTFDIDQLSRTLDWSMEAFESAKSEATDKAILNRLTKGEYSFAHQLYQEICYESMVRSRKRKIHSVIYANLINANSSTPSSHGAQLLAHHAQEAGNLELALDHLWQACTQAIAAAAIRTAQSLYRRAVLICDQIGEAADIRKIKFASLVFDALHQLAAHQETLDVFKAARSKDFSKLSENEEILIRANIATIQWISGSPIEAYEEAKKAIEMARRANYLPLTSYACFAMANLEHSRGEIKRSVSRLKKMADIFAGDNAAIRFGQTITLPGVMLRAFASWYAVDLGDLSLADQLESEARQIADQENHGYSKTLCNLALGYRLYRTEKYDRATEILSEAYSTCIDESFFGIASITAGWAAALLQK